MLDIEKVHTPHARTIDSLVEFFQIDKSNFGKALVYNLNNKPLVVIIPGDRELNETKLLNHLGLAAHDIEMADQDMIQDISGAEKGFTGPIGLKEGTRLIVDARITKMRNLVVGGNETDYHIKNANYGRDFQGEIVDDLLLVEEGDKCPKCDDSLKMARGIEVGNIFQLGTKYSQGLGAKYLDENGKEQPFYMGSYGIGITRSVAAIIEQYHDDKGIVWPLNTAPYHVIITIINTKDEEQMNLGEKLYQELTALGVEVLLDDRNERAGVKFNDRDLIGIPIRITVGKRAKESIVEYSLRSSGEKIEYKESEVLDLIKDEFEKAEFKF